MNKMFPLLCLLVPGLLSVTGAEASDRKKKK